MGSSPPSTAGWGGYTDAPNGEFVSIWGHSCGLRIGGTVDCWGHDYLGQTVAPDGRFTAVTAGALTHSCGLRTDGTIR